MKRMMFFCVLMFAMGMAARAQGGSQSSSTAQLYREATDLFRKEKFAVAQHLFDQYMKRSDAVADEMAEAAYMSAVCSEQLRNDDAHYRINEFMRLYPESGRVNMARMALGNVYFERGQYNDALHEYLSVEPSEVEFNHRSEYEYKTGYCYFQQGDKENAKKYFKRVADGKSYYRNAATYYYADILFSQRQYELADKEFRKIEKDKAFKKLVPVYRFYIKYHLGEEDEVLRMAPDLLSDPNLVLRDEVERIVGDVYFNRNEYRRALGHYRRADAAATEGNPAKAQQSNYPVGYCHYMLGQYDSAAMFLSTFQGRDDSTAQNALFTLGDTYVKLNRKAEARTAFKSAADMRHNAAIQEEAAFNYAKLSCELNPNAYNESIRSFENYLQRYPKSKRKAEIQQILTSLYCTTRNYKDALSLIERNKRELLKDATMRQAYQRILVNRGIDLFNERNLQGASACFDTAVAVNATPAITTDALYLSAETQYRLANYGRSATLLGRFFNATSRKTSPYYAQALYTAGYVNMRRKKYDLAEERFAEFLEVASQTAGKKQLLDTYNRMGDCYYVKKNFDGAIGYYDRVIKAQGQDADYATYQKALCYGAQGKQVEKLNSLNYIFEKFSNSPLSPKAMFEIANTYLICDNNEMAMLYYNNFIKRYSQSSFVPQALLNLGLVYYNTEQSDKALEVFDRLMTQYPGTDEARDALMTIKNIYVEQDRAEEYFAYVSRTTKSTVSAAEQDSTLYFAAENRYFQNNFDNAIAGFDNYIQKFPHGLFILKAHYYLADALSRNGQRAKALAHYEWVAERGNNPYTESCLIEAAAINYLQRNYAKALDNYVPLVVVSTTDGVRLQARMGIVRCHYALKDTANVAISVRELLAEPKVTTEQSDEASVMLSRSYFYAGALEEAFTAYEALMNSPNGDYMGEAAYRRASIRFGQNDLDASERIIEAVVNNPGSDYWLAKTFILWADIFHRRGNDVQARQTLQSIVDNYEVANDADEEVVSEAQQHLQSLDAPVEPSDNGSDANEATTPQADGPVIELDMED
ncbi:MAG: tetratricopeptide repeat protein [Bacteroidales bacterium]|nr:tetratricopeptide repeat protein [Bacteroidales bacterium]